MAARIFKNMSRFQRTFFSLKHSRVSPYAPVVISSMSQLENSPIFQQKRLFCSSLISCKSLKYYFPQIQSFRFIQVGISNISSLQSIHLPSDGHLRHKCVFAIIEHLSRIFSFVKLYKSRAIFLQQLNRPLPQVLSSLTNPNC